MKRFPRFAGCALFALMVAACGSDDEVKDATPPAQVATSPTNSTMLQPQPIVPTTTEAPVTTSAEPGEDISTMADIQRVIAPLGLECGLEDSALFCSRNTDSWQFRISPKGDGDNAFRKALCEGDPTYNSGGAITDGGNFVVYAGNDEQNVEGFRDELAGAGIAGLTIVRGC